MLVTTLLSNMNGSMPSNLNTCKIYVDINCIPD